MRRTERERGKEVLETKYLIVGASHAGLSAMDAIRTQDREGSLTLVSQEKCFPYSPTILPYIVSGKVDPERIFLRDAAEFDQLAARLILGKKAMAVDAAGHVVSLDSGESIGYEKLLLAAGASPKMPPLPGPGEVQVYVLRTLEDALKLREAVKVIGSALVLGAGLIGMHAAENLAGSGIRVTIVEALPQVLPGYFDGDAASLIQRVFAQQGIEILTGSKVLRLSRVNGNTAVFLDEGKSISTELVFISTGVQPRVRFLSGSGVKVDEGVLVDERMRTSAKDIWAAGDVAQARDFFDSINRVNATLPGAVEQGRIAGMDMVGDPALKGYAGGIGMNTYNFFGHRAFAAGISGISRSSAGFEVDQVFLPSSCRYQKLVFSNDRLVGAEGINSDVDPGIILELIRRKISLKDVRAKFAAAPLDMSRVLMSTMWR
jgi:phenylglyoxylate dehydrogenase epsilon subunit